MAKQLADSERFCSLIRPLVPSSYTQQIHLPKHNTDDCVTSALLGIRLSDHGYLALNFSSWCIVQGSTKTETGQRILKRWVVSGKVPEEQEGGLP